MAPKQWLQLSIRTPNEFVEPLVEVFRKYSGERVVIEQPGGFDPDDGEESDPGEFVRVTAYLPVDRKTDVLRQHIDLGVRLIATLAPLSDMEEQILQEEEWASTWKRHTGVLHVGPRLVVVPTWLGYTPAPHEVVIRLDPGMAFGTGYHPTTRLCLKLMGNSLKPSMKILDLGTGSGILAIAGAKLGADTVVALDIDPTATETAQENLRLNGVDNQVMIQQGSLPHVSIQSPDFDLIVANLSPRIILEKISNMLEILRPNGLLVVSGIPQGRASEIIDGLSARKLTVLANELEEDWIGLLLQMADNLQ